MNPKHEQRTKNKEQKQKRQEGKNKCKDKNLDNTSRLIEAAEGRLSRAKNFPQG
jgi:hypothetical protein